MSIDVQQTVREVALSTPAATRVFEKLGIDYCCGGHKPLAQACGEAQIPIQKLIESIESAARSAQIRQDTPIAEDWSKAALSDLIAHITNTHHKYTREEISRLGPLFDKVCNVHGPSHPELLEIRHDFRALAQELTVHMMKEERVLFPFIERMEEAVVAREPVVPAPFGSVNNPVSMMIHEHDAAGELLREMRKRTNAYQPPTGACTSYKTLYSALAEFERDLHQHIHLENNMLFPKAIEMEQARP